MFEYDDIQFEVMDVEGVKVRVASTESLYAMKNDTVRPEDQRDALFLKQLIKSRRKA